MRRLPCSSSPARPTIDVILLLVFMCHSSRSIAYPDAYAVRRVLDQLHGSLGGKDFRAAGRAVIHPVGEAPHLGMAALAGVSPQSIRQGGYTLKGSEYRAFDGETAGVAVGELGFPRPQLARSTRQAEDMAR